MPERRLRLSAILGAAGTCLLLLSSCSRSPLSVLGPNQPPEIEIVDARAGGRGAMGVRVRWSVRDPDGRVKLSRWAITPWRAPVDRSAGTATTAEECLLPQLANVTAGSASDPAEPERFTVWAVDDQGAVSKPATLAIFGNNVGPTVQITGPIPSQLLRAQVPSSVCITWAGNDPDGVFTQKPVKYKYRMLDLDDPASTIFLANPDSLRGYGVATNWAGWDSTSSDTEFAAFTHLTPGKSYLFALIGIDEAGAYSPFFSLNTNMLQMSIGFADFLGPQLTLVTSSIRYQYPSSAWQDTPERRIEAQVAAGEPVRIQWSSFPQPGQRLRGYRWVLDPASLDDETPRSGPNDLRHWSTLDPFTSEVALGPFSPAGLKREEHLLYIEARSNPSTCVIPGSDCRSLGIFRLIVVRATLHAELLIVDDTRLRPSMSGGPGGCPATPTTTWPSAAELDTFLYARGGVPWRCTVNPASGVLSVPGLFAGYAFDTLGTRGVLSGPAASRQTVPLVKLAEYRHVIWITDGQGSLFTNPPDSPLNPTTAIRFMSNPGMSNVLSTYVRMGGRLWVVGATATATLLPWDRTGNNTGGIVRFSSAAPYGEIASGRFAWDTPKLRSEISAANALQGTRSLGRFESSPGAYAALPELLQSRTAATDPMPPTRTVPSQFYTSVRLTEFLTQPNAILEDIDPDPVIVNEQSVLDSFYVVQGSSVPIGTGNVAMTRYHGAEHGEVVWTGFDIWSFQRAQCIGLVDGVLQGMWGLPRAPIARTPVPPPPPPPGPGGVVERTRTFLRQAVARP